MGGRKLGAAVGLDDILNSGAVLVGSAEKLGIPV
jgi:hypothetical protein